MKNSKTQLNTEISNSLRFKEVRVGGQKAEQLRAACSSRLSLQGNKKHGQPIRPSLYKTVNFITISKQPFPDEYSPLHFHISIYFVLEVERIRPHRSNLFTF